MTTRHQFRASELDRVLTCNGSISIVPLVAPRDGDEGDEGSAIHHQVADTLIRHHGAVFLDGDLPPATVPEGYRIPANSTWIPDWCVRRVLEDIPSDWSLMVEVEMAHEFARWTGTGHADIIATNPEVTEARGKDWKSGRDPVDPADNNEQIGFYIALIKLTWPTIRKVTFDIEQPRVCEGDGYQRTSTVVVKGDDLDALVASIDQRVCAAIDNRMELDSGRKQCRWCPAKLQCPAKIQERNEMKLRLTPENLAAIERLPNDALLGDWIVTMRSLKAAQEDAEKLLHKRLDEHEAITAGCGVTITRKIQKGSYTVLKPLEFLAKTRELLPSEEQIARAFEPSMTRIKDEIAAQFNVPAAGKAAVTATSIFDAHLRPLVEQGERRVLQFSQ